MYIYIHTYTQSHIYIFTYTHIYIYIYICIIVYPHVHWFASPPATDPRSVSFFPTSQCESNGGQLIDAYRNWEN